MTDDSTVDGRLDRRSYVKLLGSAGVAGTGLLAGCSGDGGSDTTTTGGGGTTPTDTPEPSDLTIGMETHFTSGAWVTALVEGAQFYALDRGYNFELFTNGQDAQTQISNIKQMINQGYDGIIVVPWNSQAVTSVIEEARSQGIPVYTVDIDAPTDAVSMNVSWSDTEAATTAGKKLVSFMQDQQPNASNYRVLEVRAPPGTNIARARHKPFADYMKNKSGVEIVGTVNGEWSRSASKQKVQQWLNANEPPHGIYAANFTMGLGAQAALKAQGLQKAASKQGHISHVQLDGSSNTHKLIKQGYIDMAIDQPVYFYGPIAVKYMIQEIRKGKSVLPKVGKTITKDDLNIESGSFKGVKLWSEPIWAPAHIVKTDSGHKRFVTSHVEITDKNADAPYLWGNIWT